MTLLAPSRSFIEPDMFEADAHAAWPFPGLEPRAYSLIMIDCAWRFECWSTKGEGKSPQAQYRCMTLPEIAALPVADLAAEDCLLWMWCTGPLANVQPQILEGWGFRFSTQMVWVKTTKNGKLAFGPGHVTRGCHEPILIGTRGSPLIAKKHRSAFLAEAREHSRKPEEAYEIARAMVPYGRAADVYSRQRRVGWEGFGDELDKFEAEVAA